LRVGVRLAQQMAQQNHRDGCRIPWSFSSGVRCRLVSTGASRPGADQGSSSLEMSALGGGLAVDHLHVRQ
jgi:hypothetical protein